MPVTGQTQLDTIVHNCYTSEHAHTPLLFFVLFVLFLLFLQDALTLALKTASDDAGHRAKLILHARAVFGAALSFAKQVSNVGNKVGGTGRPGSSDPQLRYELTLRNLIARLDEVRVAMRLLVMEQERCLLIKKEIREGKKESEGRVVVGAASSLYWLLQNGTIAIFALADPMIVAGEFWGGWEGGGGVCV